MWRAYTLSDLVADNSLSRFVLISDIEGVESDLIARDAAALESCQQMIVELHGSDAEVERMACSLGLLGFELVASRMSVFAFTKMGDVATGDVNVADGPRPER